MELPEPPEAYALAGPGTYEMPTDALLEPPGLEALRTVPSFGCEPELGCPDLGVPQELQPTSRLDERRQA